MTVHFFNEDIPNGRFDIRWGEDNKTPSVALNPGDMASFDLDVFNRIPQGTKCRVYACQQGTGRNKLSNGYFRYYNGKTFAGTFKFYLRNLGLALNWYRNIG